MTEVEEEIESLLNCFQFGHLPVDKQEISRQFFALAHSIKGSDKNRDLFQLRDCLKSLLAAKDCAVRASL